MATLPLLRREPMAPGEGAGRAEVVRTEAPARDQALAHGAANGGCEWLCPGPAQRWRRRAVGTAPRYGQSPYRQGWGSPGTRRTVTPLAGRSIVMRRIGRNGVGRPNTSNRLEGIVAQTDRFTLPAARGRRLAETQDCGVAHRACPAAALNGAHLACPGDRVRALAPAAPNPTEPRKGKTHHPRSSVRTLRHRLDRTGRRRLNLATGRRQ
jgi:hypothetical protein